MFELISSMTARLLCVDLLDAAHVDGIATVVTPCHVMNKEAHDMRIPKARTKMFSPRLSRACFIGGTYQRQPLPTDIVCYYGL